MKSRSATKKRTILLILLPLLLLPILSTEPARLNAQEQPNSVAPLKNSDLSNIIESWSIVPTSLVQRTNPPRQRLEITVRSRRDIGPVNLTIYTGTQKIAESTLGSLQQGDNTIAVLLPEPKELLRTVCKLEFGSNRSLLAEKPFEWQPPRHWTIYAISSTHTDIGLHNSQYIQRKMTVEYLDLVKELVQSTSNRPKSSQYCYTVEGTWVWGNYEQDRSESTARQFVDQYVLPGRVALSATCAGNHTQVYGLEELCRSAYTKRTLQKRWNVNSDTMLMSDNNGISWSIVAPYRNAGIKNLIFSPNQWNPLNSTIWKMDKSVQGYVHNPDAGGGGSRIDVRWDSPLPMLFYWQGANDDSHILVWCSTQYVNGGWRFGISNKSIATPETMAPLIAQQLRKMEKRLPYNVWLFTNYYDDEKPNLNLANTIRDWNAKWLWPEFRTVGNLSEPFDRIRAEFNDQVPVLRGDITGGWSWHPVATPELLAQKRVTDVALASAEKIATVARIVNPRFIYPKTELRHSWDMLIYNDEHSYGTSGYQGRRVYETWLQHRDWINKAEAAAQNITQNALSALAEKIDIKKKSILLFNPTLVPRSEIIDLKIDGKSTQIKTPIVPSFGYRIFPVDQIKENPIKTVAIKNPPTLENRFYTIVFEKDGSIKSIVDKELKREIIDQKSKFKCNQFVYTKDNHKTFVTPKTAQFTISSDRWSQTVTVLLDDPNTRARLEQRVTLPNEEKRIDLDNRFEHLYDLFNTKRYYRYGYFAFPFDVPNGQFCAQLNGVNARPKLDATGHGSDAFLAVRNWTSVENGSFGTALIQTDSNLVEFGRIHPDKTEYGRPFETTHLYSVLFNDWLQMHVPSGKEIAPRFRYTIFSFAGNRQSAGLTQLAERVVTPLATKIVDLNSGILPHEKSFISTDAKNMSLLTLKEAEQIGTGFIARFHEMDGTPGKVSIRQSLSDILKTTFRFESCSIIEETELQLTRPEAELKKFDYLTLRMTPDRKLDEVTPLPVLHAKSDSEISLTWPKIPNATQYNIYRGEFSDFKPDEFHLIETTLNNKFCDKYLKKDTVYYYRVQPIYSDSMAGKLSKSIKAQTDSIGKSIPAPIGSVYTGLVTEPKGIHGSQKGQLYLIWGQNQEPDLDHYELYRSENKDFTPNTKTFLTNVQPGPYRVGLHEENGLKVYTKYYYRVRAVNKTGQKGPFSNEFSATTRDLFR